MPQPEPNTTGLADAASAIRRNRSSCSGFTHHLGDHSTSHQSLGETTGRRQGRKTASFLSYIVTASRVAGDSRRGGHVNNAEVPRQKELDTPGFR